MAGCKDAHSPWDAETWCQRKPCVCAEAPSNLQMLILPSDSRKALS